jgi:hypothetical protein
MLQGARCARFLSKYIEANQAHAVIIGASLDLLKLSRVKVNYFSRIVQINYFNPENHRGFSIPLFQ